MNFKTVGILVLGLCFCSDVKFAGNKEWENSLTYGLFSEKLPMSLIEYSAIYNVYPKSELYFSDMKKLLIENKLNELSMGMSNDYLKALNFNSTFLRI